MPKEINIRVKLPEDFSKALDLWAYNLKQVGVYKTKAELVAKFAQIGFINEKRDCDRLVSNYRNEKQDEY